MPVQVIAWKTVPEMTCNVSSGTLNLTYSLTHSFRVHTAAFKVGDAVFDKNSLEDLCTNLYLSAMYVCCCCSMKYVFLGIKLSDELTKQCISYTQS